MHEAGANTREIAEALYAAGARANTSEPGIPPYKLRREHHITNLKMMTLFALQRLGLPHPPQACHHAEREGIHRTRTR
jgi:hypothetical protein